MLSVDIVGLDAAHDFLQRFPEKTSQAAALAINQTATRGGMKAITDEMYGGIAFPSGYLKGDRIGVTRFAKPGNLEAVITARKRATSLARFVAKGTPIGGRPRNIQVKVSAKGGSTTLSNAFLVRLRKGASKSEDNYNVGLAMFVRPGAGIKGQKSAHTGWLNRSKTLAVLYGPSVDQVFRDTRDKVEDDVLSALSREFNRQLARLTS